MTEKMMPQKTRYRPKQKPQPETRRTPREPLHEQSKQKVKSQRKIEPKVPGRIARKVAPKAIGQVAQLTTQRQSGQKADEKALLTDLEIFLVAVPGLESQLAAEAKERGFRQARVGPGGVTVRGGWPEVWRANLELRGASRVLVRIEAFRSEHLADLAKQARRVAWGRLLNRDQPFHVDVSCTKSRIYHSGAAAERIAGAISEAIGAVPSREAAVVIKARIDNDFCTIGIDTTGEPLHKRGHKQAVSKAPMRETMAAMFLRQCGFDPRAPVTVVDPMCGSGTFVIEAAEMALGLLPGRSRSFAFEQLATFDAAAWDALRTRRARASLDAHARRAESAGSAASAGGAIRFYGSDRDAGAIRMSRANAERAGVTDITQYDERDVAELVPPEGPPGLVIVNPPYGGRIGDGHGLAPVYRTLGTTLGVRFAGWRVGLITSDAALAKATGLPFGAPSAPVLHGGIKVRLYLAEPLAVRGA